MWVIYSLRIGVMSEIFWMCDKMISTYLFSKNKLFDLDVFLNILFSYYCKSHGGKMKHYFVIFFHYYIDIANGSANNKISNSLAKPSHRFKVGIVHHKIHIFYSNNSNSIVVSHNDDDLMAMTHYHSARRKSSCQLNKTILVMTAKT